MIPVSINSRSVVLEALAQLNEGTELVFPDDASPFSELGLDSLQTIHFITLIETRCGIIIGDDVNDFDDMATIGGLMAMIDKKSAAVSSTHL